MGAGAPNRTPMGGGGQPSSPMGRPSFGTGSPPNPNTQSFGDFMSQMRPQRPMGYQRPTSPPPMGGVANRVAQQGRYGDSTLVHMNPMEVRGLAALHPQGRLPTNPQTGYPEAFDLFGALSGLVGGGLGFLVGGPLGAAVGSGLGTAAYTGDIGKGIISGLLGFGLGQAGGILAGLGGEATSEVAKEALKNSVSTAAGTTAAETASPFASAALSPITEQAVQQGVSAATQQVAQQGIQAGTQAALNAPSQAPGFMDKIGQRWDALSQIPQRVQNDPSLLSKAFIENGLKTTVPMGLGVAGMMMPEQSGGMMPAGQQQYSPIPRTPRMPRTLTPPPPGYQPSPTGGPEWEWFSNNYKDGGQIEGRDAKKDFSYKEEIEKARRIPLWQAERELNLYQPLQRPVPNPFQRDQTEYRFARGGYVPTPVISSGRRISGPGGGIDDAIPAVINGREPAHLSSGEHVIPAMAVSAIGNGSTEDGHRQIEKGVDRVMQRRFGTKNRNPRPIKPGSFLR